MGDRTRRLFWVSLLAAVLSLAALGFMVGRATADHGTGWTDHPARYGEDTLSSRCVHRPEGAYVVWVYNQAKQGRSDDQIDFHVIGPLPEGRRCR